jgi:hypothetical protein
MRGALVLLVLPACIEFGGDSGSVGEGGAGDGGGAGSEGAHGSLTIDGITCTIDEGEHHGYCLDGSSSFSVDGSGSCEGVDWRATAWLPAGVGQTGGSFDLVPSAEGEGQGEVWVEQGEESWTTTSGSLVLDVSTTTRVTATFEAVLQDFIGGEPGPTASGTILCEF